MTWSLLVVSLMAAIGGSECPLPDASAGTPVEISDMKGFAVMEGDARLVRFAPVILVENHSQSLNRIGAPSARYDKAGREEIYVNPDKPVYYTQVETWSGKNGAYTNLVYRVHFEESLSDGKASSIGTGRNVGLMIIVTLDSEERPLLVNAVHTCGCFHAIFPTNYLSSGQYPEKWNLAAQTVYGEHLPGLVEFPAGGEDAVHPVIFLRSRSHRVVDANTATIEAVKTRFSLTAASMAPMETLKHLPLGNGETSFYFESGRKKGLVKGAIKKKESLLLGAWVGDMRVGQDREFGSKEDTGQLFYTTLNPTEKKASDMSDYRGFLELDGWKF